MADLPVSVSEWPTLNSDAIVPQSKRQLIDYISLSGIVMLARHLFFWGAALIFAESVAALIGGSHEEAHPGITVPLTAAILVGAYWPLKFQLWPWWGQLLASGGMIAAAFAAWMILERRSDED